MDIMVKFFHTADIHLDSPLRGLEAHEDAPVQEIRRAARRAFERLVETAIDESVDFILIAGDLYDGHWKNFHTGIFFAACMGRLHKAGIHVYIVSGNHDAASQMTKAMPLPDNVTLFSSQKPQTVIRDDLGILIHGQSYPNRAVSDNLASRFPLHDAHYFNIGLLHTALTGRPGHADYAPCTQNDLESKGYDYWALGHVHKREIVSRDPWIVFPGNIQGRHINETGPKGATMVTVDDGCIIDVDVRELDVLRWTVCRVDLSKCKTEDCIRDAVRLAIKGELDQVENKPLALRLVLTGKCPVHAQLLDRTVQWREEFGGMAAGLGDVWLEKVIFQTRRSVKLDDLFGRDTPIAGLMQSIRQFNIDHETLMEMVPELSILKSRLPAQVHTADTAVMDFSSDGIETLRHEVQELLVATLLEFGGGR
jgi:DNA repair exonuclease SbcCD nuclease subunit